MVQSAPTEKRSKALQQEDAKDKQDDSALAGLIEELVGLVLATSNVLRRLGMR